MRRPAALGGNVVVSAYGNTLRTDDGDGGPVASLLSSWESPGLESISVHQLTPELVEPLSTAELAISVDARPDDGGAVEDQALEPSGCRRIPGHTSDPRSLLALAREVYGRSFRSWLVTVPAVDLSLGEGLSAAAERGAAEAVGRITQLIGESL